MVLIARHDLEVLLCKLMKYERFLHDLKYQSSVCMDPDGVRDLINNACRWSAAHRDGNGEFSEEEVQEHVFRAFKKLLDHPPRKGS